MAAFRLSGYPHREEATYVSHTVPKRHVARVALSGGQALVLLVFRSSLLGREPARDGQKAALRRVFADMGWETAEILRRLDEVDDLYFDHVSQIRVPRQKSALWLRGFFAPGSVLTLALRRCVLGALSRPVLARHLLSRSLRDAIRVPVYGTPGWLEPARHSA